MLNVLLSEGILMEEHALLSLFLSLVVTTSKTK
jgi:hypothetical protein